MTKPTTTSYIQEAFHGTNLGLVRSILKNNFKESTGIDEWAGNGVYFFIEGIRKTPELDAERWAIATAWNNDRKRNDYGEYAVIRAEVIINEDTLLDLTTNDGLQSFNYTRDKLTDKIRLAGRRLRRGELNDAHVIKVMQDNSGIEVVKANFYIKFAKERKMQLFSRVPNVTVLTVSNPDKNIDKKLLKVIKTGEVR